MHADRLPDLLQRLDRHAASLRQTSLRFSRLRLAAALGGIGLALALGGTVGPLAGWLTALGTILVFSVLVRFHDRVEVALKRNRLWRTLQARHLARVTLDWDALGPAPAPAPPGHAFASDLDVVGPRSLLHLLDTTGTAGARTRLRGWLLASVPDADAGRLRQRRVRALVPRRRLRDRLALLAHTASGSADARWSDASLRTWLDAPEADGSVRTWALVLGSLAALTAILIVIAIIGGPSLWGYSFVVYLLLYVSRYAAFSEVFDRAYDLQHGLAQIAPMLDFAEADGARRDPDLAPLWEPLAGESAPSRHLKRLDRIASAAAVTRNDVGRVVINAILPYDLLLTLALNRLRTEFARLLPPWLDAVYEIEALGALAAAYDFRREATAFPDLSPLAPEASGAPPLFRAADLRHPLLPLGGARGNEIELGAGEVILVTGSNMSGKSTFLRSIGVASVLGWAGGPVWAESASLRPLRPFASMRIGDVLQEGLSTFYAEVKRLKALLDSVETPADRRPGQVPASGESAEAVPSLVLIDEMLRGTNNRERLAGAQAIVRALAGAHATSLVATHDLALADLEQEDARVSNAHFREEAEGDRLAFDYLLRPGPCPTTNALIIMHRAGLPVVLEPATG
ncbi:MutS-related protein [Rubricoccus marinus]|uniref:DNA mismatch repair proteins mutS family domain-containing protein n=1 Tax=Rubricoccus marinus TaxID=716817 RepID=A0A259U353_9BACT|nr:hypothetical protein [Rubricoccus marinus]OZC04463.1 hypothetical protein BSZ36_16640 [Rubricoccus marinus]